MCVFDSPKDVGSSEQPLGYELRIKSIPLLSRYELGLRVASDLSSLLQVSSEAEQHHHHVQRVAGEVDEVPHVPEVGPDAFDVDLLGLLPDEAWIARQDDEVHNFSVLFSSR